jgi:iron complex outermembrane receptor protein
VYVDDVPYNSALSMSGLLFNIDSLAVYRSSQPGLFGKNAYAGAMDIKTQQAENDLHSGVALEMGNYNLYQVTANSSGAIIKDQLYFNLNGYFQQRDGFLYNSYLNTSPDNQQKFGGRAAFKWTPNKAWDVRLTLSKEDLNYGSSRFVRLDSPDFYTIRSNVAAKLKQANDNQALRIAYNTDDYELLSVSSRQSWQMNPYVADPALLLPPPPYLRTQTAAETGYTQEFRLRPKDQHATWQWQSGLFYSTVDKHGVIDGLFPVTGHINTNLKKSQVDTYAVFGQLAYQGIKGFKPYFDLRFDTVQNAVDASTTFPDIKKTVSLQQRNSSFFVSPKLGLDVTLSPNALVYAATGVSYKPSGFTFANINSDLSHFNKERLWHNELGVKTQWFDDRFKFNVVGFYYDMKNYQVERFFTATDYAVINAPKAHSVGFEVESQARLMDTITLDGNFGYTHIRFDNYTDPISKVNYAGKTAPFIPELTGLLALQYKHPQGYFARVEGVWTGRTYFDENNSSTTSQNAYALANARVGYEGKNYSVFLFVKNIADTHYYTFKTSVLGAPSDPRLFGVRLAANF